MKTTILGIIIVMAGIFSAEKTFAQTQEPKFDVGIQFSTLRLREIGEGAAGVGGWFSYHVTGHLALEGVVNRYPENPSGNFGETQVLFGALAGRTFDNLGVFAKARAGFIHFGGDFFTLRLNDRTHPTIDLGGVLEYYPSKHIVLRMDVGDSIIMYGRSTYLGAGPTVTTLGTLHNLGAAFGIGIRF